MTQHPRRRPSSQEVAEIFVANGSNLDDRDYRDALRCHFGSCYYVHDPEDTPLRGTVHDAAAPVGRTPDGGDRG